MPIGVPKVPYRLPGSQYEQWISIYSRLSVERILFLGQEVTDGLANALVAQMLYLDSEDPTKPIYLYINSPGGFRYRRYGHLRHHAVHQSGSGDYLCGISGLYGGIFTGFW